jgi:hypothetical protein
VTGPLVRAAIYSGEKVTVLPGAVTPEGAGEEVLVLDYACFSLAQLHDACRATGLPVGGTKAVLRARLGAAAPLAPRGAGGGGAPRSRLQRAR